MKKLLLVLALASCKDDAPRAKPMQDLGEVPAFSLHDQTDAVTTEAWLRDHVTIVDFVFTRCDTICPMISLKMVRLGARTKDAGVQLLSFSVDPAYDTPAVLAEYATHYGADAARWRFLTGDYAEVRTMVEGALMTAMDPQTGTTASGAPNISHGGHLLLVGPDLHIRGVYDSADDARMKELERDALELAKQH